MIFHILAHKLVNNAMSLFIGIDGGGTKTKCVVIDDNLNIISEAEDNATNPFVVGFDESAKNFFNSCRLPARNWCGSYCNQKFQHSDNSKKLIW